MGYDKTADKYVEANNIWDLENASKEAYRLKETLEKEDIHAISLHKSKVDNEANSGSFTKSCRCC